MAEAIQLSKTPIHISTGSGFQVLENFGYDESSFENYISAHCTEEDPGCLVLMESSPTDWSTWERHPEGDELVIVISGSGTFYQQADDGELAIPFKPGDTILNRQGVWHTADVTEPLTGLYITTCPGTDHKPR